MRKEPQFKAWIRKTIATSKPIKIDTGESGESYDLEIQASLNPKAYPGPHPWYMRNLLRCHNCRRLFWGKHITTRFCSRTCYLNSLRQHGVLGLRKP